VGKSGKKRRGEFEDALSPSWGGNHLGGFFKEFAASSGDYEEFYSSGRRKSRAPPGNAARKESSGRCEQRAVRV